MTPPIQTIRVDGGASRNALLMQLQSDLSRHIVQRPRLTEVTAWGAALLVGLAVGYWKGLDASESLWQEERRFSPLEKRSALLDCWNAAIQLQG